MLIGARGAPGIVQLDRAAAGGVSSAVTHRALNLSAWLPSTDEAFSAPVNATTLLFAGGGSWAGAFFLNTATGAISAVRNGSLGVARGRGVAAACTDGGLVVLAGGQESSGKQSAAVDLYDTRTDTFSRGPDLSEGRSFLGAAAWGGYIYFAGGEAEKDKTPPQWTFSTARLAHSWAATNHS